MPVVDGLVVEVQGLWKKYNGKIALRDIGLEVRPGEIMGVVGPNGAGKTTLLKIVGGLLRPSDGSVRVFGRDPIADRLMVKRKIGYVPEEDALYDEMSVAEYLLFFADLYDVPRPQARARVHQYAEMLELNSRQRTGDLSHGMKRKVSLARALMHEPALLILDEPMIGLDAPSAKRLLQHVKKLPEKGKSVLFSAHNMHQIEQIADRVVILFGGRRLVETRVEDAVSPVDGSFTVTFTLPADVSAPGKFAVRPVENGIYTAATQDLAHLGEFITWVVSVGGQLRSLQPFTPSLEDFFFRVLDHARDESVARR